MTSARRRPSVPVALSLILAVLLTLLAPMGTASADAPPLLPDQLVDAAGVLAADQVTEITAALNRLSESSDLHMSAVYVTDFDGKAPADWARETEQLNGLSYRDLLLAVAVGTKEYYLGSAEPIDGLNSEQIQHVGDTMVGPAVRSGQWARAATDAASELGKPASRTWIWLLSLVALVVVGALAWLGAKRVRRARSALPESSADVADDLLTVDELSQQPLDALDPWSSELLMLTDNAVSVSGDELALAQAEFGDDGATEYTDALASAESAVAASFRLRRTLDDQSGMSGAQRRALLVEIISMCSAANSTLDASVPAFDKQRDLLTDAADRLDALGDRAEELHDRLDAAAAGEAELKRKYGGPVVESIYGNTALATELVTFAEDAVTQGHEAIAAEAEMRQETVAAIRSAECALDTAEKLLEALADVGQNLELIAKQSTGPEVATAHVAAAESYIDTRRGVIGTAPRTCLSEAERVLSESGPTDRAMALATDALALSRQDVAAWQHTQGADGAPVLTGVLVDVVVASADATVPDDLGSGGFSSGGRSPGSFGGVDTSGRIGTGGRK
ncbi:MAG: TPM domain-containing protein [Gordonia sp. (in: high G+C Gram-positive bacteria)]|uniref:TPM domain-containing protein n=1 Tax=Gordonia sp. (in: high G+C Gram-positive bacteria) TaxID=84139 RepID=UPI003BB7AB53